MDDAEQNKKMLEQLIENLSEKSVKELIEHLQNLLNI